MRTLRFRDGFALGAKGSLVAVLLAASLQLPAFGQGNGAAMSVRGRASGLQLSPGAVSEAPQPPPPPEGPPAGPPPASPGAMPGKIDTTFVAPNAAVFVVLRPAQIVTSPVAQMLPTEVATAVGRQYLGAEPADIDEITMFGDPSNLMAPSYGLVFKFNKPFRAVSIPPMTRMGAKLADFNGKKYFQNAMPTGFSFYGSDNKTLIMAPDATLRQVVQASAEPKSGALMDRVRDVPSGSDLYAVINVASLKGILQIEAGKFGQQIPPAVIPVLDGMSAIELTVNLATRGPLSCVVHCNDDASAQQLEMMINAARQSAPPGPPEAPGPAGMAAMNTPISEAMNQFEQRMKQKFQPQRNGNSISLFRIEADDPLQPQLLGMVIGAAMGAKMMPSLESMQKLMASPGGAPMAGPPGAVPAGPEGAAPPVAGPEGAVPAAAPAAPPARQRLAN